MVQGPAKGWMGDGRAQHAHLQLCLLVGCGTEAAPKDK